MSFPKANVHRGRRQRLGRANYPNPPTAAPVASIVGVESLTAHSITLTWDQPLGTTNTAAVWHAKVTTAGVNNPVTFIGCDGVESTMTCTNVVDPPTTVQITNPSGVVFFNGATTTDNAVHDVPP